MIQDQNNQSSQSDAALAAKIVAHCTMMAKHDRAYALFAWRQYIDALPWLELDKVKKAQQNE